jgi:ArsR family transcriptional regulator, arsenate/arsenite/antimonite-responsive transcriptional repressor
MGISEVFRALGDPTRREMIRLLRGGDLTAGELAERFDLARSTLSEHCAVLREAGLVVTERQGTKVVYSLNTSTAEDALAAVFALLGADGTAGARGTDTKEKAAR